MENVKRAVGYFRVSTKKEEQKQSLENQKSMFLQEIKVRGYTLQGFYIDEKTGTTKKRKNLLKMLEDAEKGLFDVIIVKELSRLARNVEVASEVKRFTETQNVRIISLDGLVDTFDQQKNQNFLLYAWLYQNEAQQTSNRVKASYKTKAEQGFYLGSIPPYSFYLRTKNSLLEVTKLKRWLNLFLVSTLRHGAKIRLLDSYRSKDIKHLLNYLVKKMLVDIGTEVQFSIFFRTQYTVAILFSIEKLLMML